MNSLTRALLAATVLATVSLSAQAEEKDYVILKVNGENIMRSEVDEVWKTIFPAGEVPSFDTFDETIRQNVLRGMVSEKLMMKEAEKEGIAEREDVKKRLETAKNQIIIQTFLAEKSKPLTTDDKLRAAFNEKNHSATDQEEVRARHILVKTEAEANEIYDKVKNKGVDFEKLAQEKSEDKGSGAQGGDLGYFTADRMVPQFSKAAFALKKGEISKPVKSDFGWHVIKLEDRRALPKATFEQSKEQIKEELSSKAIQGYLEGLLKDVDVKYLDAAGKEKEFKKAFK